MSFDRKIVLSRVLLLLNRAKEFISPVSRFWRWTIKEIAIVVSNFYKVVIIVSTMIYAKLVQLGTFENNLTILWYWNIYLNEWSCNIDIDKHRRMLSDLLDLLQ